MQKPSLLPQWLKEYRKDDFRFDLLAGFTVAVLIVPQGMAYALLAGLPPVYGLYASIVPMIVYAFFGTSRQLSVGPVAIDSILTAVGVSIIAQAGTELYISMAIVLAMLVGLLQFALGVSRLGVLVNFLSHPVILGFTSAAAIIIGLSQLKYLLGIEIPGDPYLQNIIASLVAGGYSVHLLTLGIGIFCIVFLLLIKQFLPLFPGPLIIAILATIAVYLFRLDQYGVSIIGSIPQGLPIPGIPVFDIDILKKLLPTAFAIALVSFMESNAVARALRAKHKTYRVIPNKELMAIGMANLVGSFFKSFPVSGGFSRSAINDQAGARTGLAAIITALLVLLTLLFLTPLFYYLPTVVLASIILVTVYKLITIREAKRLWHLDRKDFFMLLATFLGTLFLGIGTGIGIGVLLSLAWIIYEASYPHYAELGRIPGTHTFRNVRRFQETLIADDLLIFRFDAPLFYANIERFREVLFTCKSHRKEKLKAIIIDMESNITIDSSALVALEDIIDEISRENILLLFADIKGPVRDKFHKSGLIHKLGDHRFFITVEDAVDYVSGIDRDFTSEIAIQANK